MAGLLSKLFKAFANPAEATRNHVSVYIRCKECGSLIELRLRKTDEIQRNLEEGPSSKAAFFVNKHVVDSNSRCRNRMDIRVEFDENYFVTDKIILSGKGEFITGEEYARLKADAEN